MKCATILKRCVALICCYWANGSAFHGRESRYFQENGGTELEAKFFKFFFMFQFHSFIHEWTSGPDVFISLADFHFFFVSWKKLMHSNQMAIRPIECQPNVIFEIYLINFILTELIGIIWKIWCNFLKIVKLILIRSMNFLIIFLNKLQFNVRSQWIE